MSSSRQLAAIMFADIQGYTALMQEDEVKAKTLRDKFQKTSETIIPSFNGQIVQFAGDGMMCLFNSAVDAVNAAIDIQEQMKQEPIVPLRIGIHSGDVIIDEKGVFGDGVNLASRIESFAVPGSVFISGKVYQEIKNKPSIKVIPMGSYKLKNVTTNVELFAIGNKGLVVPQRKKLEGKGKLVSERKWLLPLTIIIILGMAATIYFTFFRTKTTSDQIESIAVLPFTNLTGSEEQEYMISGLQDALITELSHIKNLRVISRVSAMKYRETEKSVSQIAKELNVDAVIEATVYHASDSVRINVQLIQAFPKEDHIWAQVFDRQLKNVLPMISEVTQTIAQKIRITLSPDEIKLVSNKRMVDPENYKLYVKGKYFLDKHTPEGFQKGFEFLNQAIENDPSEPLPYAAMAIGYGDLGHLPVPPREAFPKAKAYALKALSLDSTLVEAHTALAEAAMYYDHDFKAAEKSFRNALYIDSNFAPALANYGWLMDIYEREEEAERFMKKACEMDPLAPIYRVWLAWWYWDYANGKQYDIAVNEVKEALAIRPDYNTALFVLGGIYAQMGNFDEAISLHKKVAELSPNHKWAIGKTYAMAGRRKEALAVLDGLEKTPANAWGFMQIYISLGDIDSALEWVKVGYDLRHPFIPWLLTSHDAEPLKKDPRFQKILLPITDALSGN